MKATIGAAVLGLVGLLGSSAFAKGGEDGVRDSIGRALPYLEREGVWWIEKKNCVSCHHSTYFIWAKELALRSGFDVDVERLEGQRKWVWESMLKPVEADPKKPEEKVEPGTVNGDRNVEGVSQLLVSPASESLPDPVLKKLRGVVLKNWDGDGRREPGGQLPRQKRRVEETRSISQRWAMLAIGKDGTAKLNGGGEAEGSEPATTVEWFALDLLSDGGEKSVGDLVERQNDDGGWSWADGEPSDPMATGQALFALGRSGNSKAHAAVVRRARDFLVGSQDEGGHWVTKRYSGPLRIDEDLGFLGDGVGDHRALGSGGAGLGQRCFPGAMTAYYLFHAGAFGAAFVFGVRSVRSNPELGIENALRLSKGSVLVPIGLLVVASLGAAAQFHDPFCAALPLPVQHFASWITWGSLSMLGAIVTGYTLALAIGRKHDQVRALFLAVLLINVATGISSYRFLLPVAPRLGEEEMRGGIVLQTEESTCAAATLANIARRFGDQLSEKEAAAMLMTTRYGSEIGSIRYCLHKLGYGFRTLRSGEVDSLSEVATPAIVFIDQPGVGTEAHAVAYMRHLGNGYEIWDPTKGRVLWGEAEMDKLWHGSGIVCTKES